LQLNGRSIERESEREKGRGEINRLQSEEEDETHI
jgi:hypothetical protein